MIVALAGLQGAGKDTVADILTEIGLKGLVVGRIQIAGPVKTFCRELFGWGFDHTDGSLKDVEDPKYPLTNQPGYLTPRRAMQQLGGDFAEATYKDIYAHKAAAAAYDVSRKGGLAIITDCRYTRDLAAVKKYPSVTVHVVRPSIAPTTPSHSSEKGASQEGFSDLIDYVLNNDGDLDKLRFDVNAFVVRKLWPSMNDLGVRLK